MLAIRAGTARPRFASTAVGTLTGNASTPYSASRAPCACPPLAGSADDPAGSFSFSFFVLVLSTRRERGTSTTNEERGERREGRRARGVGAPRLHGQRNPGSAGGERVAAVDVVFGRKATGSTCCTLHWPVILAIEVITVLSMQHATG